MWDEHEKSFETFRSGLSGIFGSFRKQNTTSACVRGRDILCIYVPRPLINDLWVFLFQKIDAECVKWANWAGTSVYVKAFIVNKCPKPFFLEQHINIVNIVPLQSFWFICTYHWTIITESAVYKLCRFSVADPEWVQGVHLTQPPFCPYPPPPPSFLYTYEMD